MIDIVKKERIERNIVYGTKKARAWRNWSVPTRYSLLNQYTREIECVIEYPLELPPFHSFNYNLKVLKSDSPTL